MDYNSNYTGEQVDRGIEVALSLLVSPSDINSKIKGALFCGLASTNTNPYSPFTKVFYIASEIGTYTHFDNLSVSDGEYVIFFWDLESWNKLSIPRIPSSDFNNLIGRVDNLENGGYLYVSKVSSPSFNPGTPSSKVFYIAESSEEPYVYFDNLPVDDNKVVIFKYNPQETNQGWVRETFTILSSSLLNILAKEATSQFIKSCVSNENTNAITELLKKPNIRKLTLSEYNSLQSVDEITFYYITNESNTKVIAKYLGSTPLSDYLSTILGECSFGNALLM